MKLKKRQSFKNLPLELYFDIFKSIKTYPNEFFHRDELKIVLVNSMNLWREYAINLLTTSKIIYNCCNKALLIAKNKMSDENNEEMKKEMKKIVEENNQEIKKIIEENNRVIMFQFQVYQNNMDNKFQVYQNNMDKQFSEVSRRLNVIETKLGLPTSSVASGQIGDYYQNVYWPFGYYGSQNSAWGYPSPLIDNSVREMQNFQIVPYTFVASSVGSTASTSSGNLLDLHPSIYNMPSMGQSLFPTFLVKHNGSSLVSTGQLYGHNSTLAAPITGGKCSQQQEIEINQSKHFNISSSISNLNETENIENESERQKYLISQLRFPPNQQLTSEVMRRYLTNPGSYECELWIFHAQFARKSYTNDKRFFYPPPCVYLLGDGWKNRTKALDQILKHLNEQNELNCLDFFRNGEYSLETLSELNVTIGLDSPQNNVQALDFSKGKNYSVAEPLIISDTENRKYVYLQTKFSHVLGIDIGTFSSQRINVISNPSNKKQIITSSESENATCVDNGSEIALFTRSKTFNTKYLFMENNCFCASSTNWGTFLINSVNHAQLTSNNPNISQTSITYGSVIQLLDVKSNIALPKLIIRKVNKQMVLLDPSCQGEPVSQFHKCAFQILDTSGTVITGQESLYLCLLNDTVIQHKAVQIDMNVHQICFEAVFTLNCILKSVYKWAEPLTLLGPLTRLPITPMPILYSFDIKNKDNIIINGINFNRSLRVWLGATPMKTFFISDQQLKCLIPSLNTICIDLGLTTETAILATSKTVEFPISFVREEDCIIYATYFSTSLDSLSNLINRQPLSSIQIDNQLQSKSLTQNNNSLLETSTNKINNFNRFHPYWKNNENNKMLRSKECTEK